MTARTVRVALVAGTIAAVSVTLRGVQRERESPDVPLAAGERRVPFTRLLAGQCFNAPPSEEFHVRVIACSAPHRYEAFAVLSLDGARGAPYPGDNGLARMSYEACYQALTKARHATIGTAYGSLSVIPRDRETWDDGNRRLVCAVAATGMAPWVGRKLEPGSNRGAADLPAR